MARVVAPINDHEAEWAPNDAGTPHSLVRPTRRGATGTGTIQDPIGANVITSVGPIPGNGGSEPLPFPVAAFMHDDGSILIAVHDEAHTTTCTFHRLKCTKCTLTLEFPGKKSVQVEIRPKMADES